ncbi:hypothetical protein O181_055302 [Austropuccinia psidii MF-1]|uniref:CBF1-interacting co-repressor CIR N-terminal domain-containing protein n=1 Tax=Austropuccinia psidii MF-1 TaxID=1389203 RepID=A0A9Q3E8K4_9BASI|nr:hypothetical protein [Austropuccinia psidii MF-1]
MGKLNILHHKSYHVYNRENVERVKRDELRAQLEDEAKTQSTIAANSEARLSLLRSQREKSKHESSRQKQRRGEKALEDQLKGKSRYQEEAEAARDGLTRPKSATDNSSIIDPQSGHINFWSGLEHQSTSKVFGVSGLETNEAYMKDQKQKEQKWEELITMRLDRPAHELKPWYNQEDLINGEEKKLSSSKIQEKASKEEDMKKNQDPLNIVKSALYPSSFPSGSHFSRKRRERQASRSPSPICQNAIAASIRKQGQGTILPPSSASKPPSTVTDKPQIMRVDGSAERLKAQTLIEHRRKRTQSHSSNLGTPAQGYSDVYNRDELNALKRQSTHPKHRSGRSFNPKRRRYWD